MPVDRLKDVFEAELQQLDQPTAAADAANDPEDSLDFEPSDPPAVASPQPDPVQDLGTVLNGAALYVVEQTKEPSASGD